MPRPSNRVASGRICDARANPPRDRRIAVSSLSKGLLIYVILCLVTIDKVRNGGVSFTVLRNIYNQFRRLI